MSGMTKQDILYENRTLQKIVGKAARRVPGVLGPGGGVLCGLRESLETVDDIDLACGVTASEEDRHVNAEVLLTIDEATEDMTQLMKDVEAAVRKDIEAYTGLTAGAIHVEIVDTATPEAYEKRFRQA